MKHERNGEMSEEFRLNFKPTVAGFLLAGFIDVNDNPCVVEESRDKDRLWLGCDSNGYEGLAHINRDHARALGAALSRFARTGSLAEPTPTESLTNVFAAFDEEEAYYELTREVARLSQEFARERAALKQTTTGAERIRAAASKAAAESALCEAVEVLETWLKQHESEEKR